MPDPGERSVVGVVFPRGKECFPVCDFPRRQLRLPRLAARLAWSSGLPLLKGPNLGPLFADTAAEGPIIGDHYPFRSSSGLWKEAKN